MNSQLSGAEFQTIRVITEGKLLHKRSNGTTEGIVRYVVNGEQVTQPFGYCECRYDKPAPVGRTSNKEEESSRYKRSLSRRSKRQLSKDLFTPNVDDQFVIYRSFDNLDKDDDDFSGPSETKPSQGPSNNRRTHHIPIEFEPVYPNRDSIPLPKERRPRIDTMKESHKQPKSEIRHPQVSSRQYESDQLRKSKQTRYSELDDFDFPPTHESNEHWYPEKPKNSHSNKPLPDFYHHLEHDRNIPESVDDDDHHLVPDFRHSEHSITSPYESRPELDDHNKRPSFQILPDFYHHGEHKSYPPMIPMPPSNDRRQQPDLCSILSRVRMDYLACCDECRRKIIEKYSIEGCDECAKSLKPIDTKETPCQKHETLKNLSKKCRCKHNRNILENLAKISEKLCELSEARLKLVQRKKEVESSSDVKKNLLRQLNKIYEKLSSLKSADEMNDDSQAKGNESVCSKCKKSSKRPR